MSVTVLREDKHVLKETQVAKFFRRVLRQPDMVTFFHVETGQWILAYWVNKMARAVEELEDLGGNFEAVTPQFVEMIRSCWGPIDWGLKKRRLLSKEGDRIRREQDDIIEEQARYDWAKKRLAHKAPVPYAFQCPLSGGQSDQAQAVGEPG